VVPSALSRRADMARAAGLRLIEIDHLCALVEREGT
jgi:hypothetical protein